METQRASYAPRCKPQHRLRVQHALRGFCEGWGLGLHAGSRGWSVVLCGGRGIGLASSVGGLGGRGAAAGLRV